MNSLKVTHISTVHPVFDIRIFYKECRSLAASGMQVNLVITHDKEELIDNVRIIPLSKSRNRLTRIFIKPFAAFSKALKTKADIFHFHDPELIIIGLFLKILGKRVIYDIHEDIPSQILDKYWIHKKLRVPISTCFKLFELFAIRFFDGIVTATPHIRNIFIKNNKNSINVNNYPLSEERVHLDGFTEKKTKKKIVSYIGGISKQRGIFELLKAIEGTDITLYLAGETSPKSLRKDLENCCGWKNVVYFGQVERKDICSILLNSQAGICTLYPTKAFVNSVPIKIFEYMNAGIPIIISNFPLWKEMFKNTGNAFFVNPLNPEEIKESIGKLMEDDKKVTTMGKNGLMAIQKKYNCDIEKEKLINLYNKIAK